MLAVLYVLQHCGLTIQIATDYLLAVTGFRRGKQWCESSRNKCVDVWRQTWGRIDDIGVDNVRISKGPGHATWKDVSSGKGPREDKIGNDRADARAKGHARASTSNDDVVEVAHLESRVCESAR